MLARLLLVVLGILVGVGGTLGVLVITGDTPRLEDRSDGFGAIRSPAEPDMTYTYALGRVCVEGPHRVTINAVRPVRTTGNLELGAFGATSPPEAIGDSLRGSFRAYARAVGAHQPFSGGSARHVTTRCSSSYRDGTFLAVEVKASSLPAAVDGFELDYTVDSHRRTLRLDTAFTLCAGDTKNESIADQLGSDSSAADCRDVS